MRVGDKLFDDEVEVVGKQGGGVYLVKCSVCAEDTELHGEAVFKAYKGNLTKGHRPCGCAKGHNYSKDQFTLRVNRECAVRGYTLLGFVEDRVSAHTKLKLSCDNCNKKWESTTMSSFFAGCGCGDCKLALNQAKAVVDTTDRLTSSGVFKEGTVFTKSDKVNSDGSKVYWDYICPVCSNDEYVKADICTGIFSIYLGHALKGKLACRCSKSPRWTKEQRLHQVNKLTAQKPKYTFNGFIGEFNGNRVFLDMHCADHGPWTPNIATYVDRKSDCPACAKYGYDKSKAGYLYVLKVGGDSPFVGYGISNRPKIRIRTHITNLTRAGLVIEDKMVFKFEGAAAQSLEGLVKANFMCYPQDVVGFKTEATTYNNYNNLVDYLKGYTI